MALGPVGNVIFVNQQTPAVASIKADQLARLDFQNMAAQHIVNEKEKEVQEIRPTEENQKIDPDREHQRQEADEETKEQKTKSHKTNLKEEEESSSLSLHHLDIIV